MAVVAITTFLCVLQGPLPLQDTEPLATPITEADVEAGDGEETSIMASKQLSRLYAYILLGTR